MEEHVYRPMKELDCKIPFRGTVERQESSLKLFVKNGDGCQFRDVTLTVS
jgi:hypothetical protein